MPGGSRTVKRLPSSLLPQEEMAEEQLLPFSPEAAASNYHGRLAAMLSVSPSHAHLRRNISGNGPMS